MARYASGAMLRPATWRRLEELMREDLDHYDVVDWNCHHSVQHAWRSLVVPDATDPSEPAPDTEARAGCATGVRDKIQTQAAK